MDTLQKKYLRFPNEYSFYNEYFKTRQLRFFKIMDKQNFIISNKALCINWEQQIALLNQELDTLMRLVIGEINFALYEDEADLETKKLVREITRLAFSEEAYREYRNQNIVYKPIGVFGIDSDVIKN